MQGQEYPYAGSRIMRIRNVDPLSLAKIQGVLGLIFGLIIGGILALLSLALAGVASQSGAPGGTQGGALAVFAAFGIFSIVLYPLFYGVGGFLAGLIGALVYNLCAKVVGGVEITVE